MKLKITFSIILLTIILATHGQNKTLKDSLLNELNTATADSVKVNVLNALSRHFKDISEFEISMHYADSALALANKINYKKGKGDAYSNIASNYLGQSNYVEALRYNELSLKLREEIGDKKGVASSFTDIGYVYLDQGNFSQAFRYSFESLKMMKEARINEGIANAYYNLGLIYYRLGAYSESLANFLSALKIYEEIGDQKGVANSYNAIGNIYKEQAKYDLAMKYYQVALKMREEAGNKQAVAWTNNNIGIVYQLQGDFSEAMKIYLKNLKIAEEIGDKRANSKLYCSIGQIHFSQKNYSQALNDYLKALKIAEDINVYPLIIWIKINLGTLNIRLKNYQDARQYLEDAISLSMQYGKLSIHEAYRSLAEIDIAEGDFENAVRHYKYFTIYKDSLFNEESNNKLTQLEFQFETEKKDQEIALLNKDKELHESQLEKQKLIRNGMIAGAVFILLVGLILFRSFRLRKKVEKQDAIIKERQRISADLHDDVGSGLSRILLLSELVQNKSRTQEIRKEASKISSISHELSSKIGEIIWAMNSNNDYVENLVAYIRRYAAEYFENSSIKLKINTPIKLDHAYISGEHRQHIFYAVKEALHNVIKHAQANEAKLKFIIKHDMLSIVIQDNGKGFPEGELNSFGNGLNNMRNRMKRINGNCIFENNNGARIILTLPL